MWGAAPVEATEGVVLFESGKVSPVPCMRVINARKQGTVTDFSNFTSTDPLPIGNYLIKNAQYSLEAPASFSPLTGFIDGTAPDPTGTLDLRLQDTGRGSILVASPQKKNAAWAGKTSIDQVGTPEQALAALSGAKLQEVVQNTTVTQDPAGRVYYAYELCFKSPPAKHRMFVLTVVDGELIVLTLICGGSITGPGKDGNDTLWDVEADTFRRIAASFRAAPR